MLMARGHKVLLLAAVVLAAGAVPAQDRASLLKDIRTVAFTESAYPLYPQCFIEYNGLVYFQAIHRIAGFELWRTDGTQSGTFLVADIRPGRNR